MEAIQGHCSQTSHTFFEIFFQKLLYMLSRKAFQVEEAASLADSLKSFIEQENCSMFSEKHILDVSRRAFCGSLDLKRLFKTSRILQQTKEWSLSQSALWYDLVSSTLLRCCFFTTIRPSWCQCLERGCLQETLCCGLVWKNEFDTHRLCRVHNSNSRTPLEFCFPIPNFARHWI